MNSALVASGLLLLAAAGAVSHAAPLQGPEQPYLAITLAIAAGQALIIGGLLVQRARRRQTEQQLAESETFHRLTLGSISDAVFITTDDGSFRFVCPNVHVIFGWSRRETEQLGNICRLLGDRIPDPAATRSRGEISNHECDILDKAGRKHHLLVSVKRVSIRGGTRLFSCRDITDRVRAEDANRQLAHVHRLAGMGALTGMIAHEVNQPLGAILANAEAAEMLLERPDPPLGEIREILADIRRSDLRADEAIRHIRTLLRRQELKIEPLRIDAIIRDVLQLVAGDASRRRIAMRIDADGALPLAAGDPVHLQHVILNLVLNAMEAMANTPAGERQLIVRARHGGSRHLQVTIEDRGRGIPPEELCTVFESFFTTKPSGMGLGLSIARSIISAHQGRIWAENNEAGGASFHFTLPVAEATAAVAVAG